MWPLILLLQPVYGPPAGDLPAMRRPGAETILPGGRKLTPLGRQYTAGPGSFSLAISPSGKTVVTASTGPNQRFVTVLHRDDTAWRTRRIDDVLQPARVDKDDWRSVFLGLAFSDDRNLFASEGDSGRVRWIDARNGNSKHIFDLNQGEFRNSFTGDLAYDRFRRLLFVLDQGNSRLAVFETGRRRILSSLRLDLLPVALALSPDANLAYVALQPDSLAVIDVRDPANPKLDRLVPAGAGPAAVTAAGDRVFVSNSLDDSVTVIDARTLEVEKLIPIRIPDLEAFRGVLPLGSLYHEPSGWLLVAEAGIHAVGVIDTGKLQVIGHLPVAWFPARLVEYDSSIFVACGKGHGAGPNAGRRGRETGGLLGQRRGAIVTFPLPDPSELARLTERVLANNGFLPRDQPPPQLPGAVEHVVLIVKQDRSFDEIFGDLPPASNGSIAGLPLLARFGRYGIVNQYRGVLQQRLGLRNVNVTPNHRAMAQRWAFSDNFYADSDVGADGAHWLAGPRGGALWGHLERHGVTFRAFGAPLDTDIPDQRRATRFIREIEELYVASGNPLPRFLYIHLPNDRIGRARPGEGYPFPASYIADNDYALGRIVEYLSYTPWWSKMAIFVTEDEARGAADHIDAHRTILLVASPYAKKNYVSRVNTGFPGLLKTVFRLLGVPPLNLFDATAADLSGCFTSTPDVAPYEALAVSPDLFDPGKLAEAEDHKPEGDH